MRRILSIGLLLVGCNLYAWNALGHKIVAQIAYDNLNPHAKQICDEYINTKDYFPPSPDFVAAAPWLDKIRGDDVHWFDSLHYINIPFSKSRNQALPPINAKNVLFGVKQAITVLNSTEASKADKALNLRILIHLMGDIHQPLHTATKVSRRLPKGDKGGNLLLLGRNPIGKNIHQFWDNGGGYLTGRNKIERVRSKAAQLEKQGTCAAAQLKMHPEEWVEDAHQIALGKVYTIASGRVPTKRYKLNAQLITQQQLWLAGCRLAAVLNNLH